MVMVLVPSSCSSIDQFSYPIAAVCMQAHGSRHGTFLRRHMIKYLNFKASKGCLFKKVRKILLNKKI